MVTCEACKTVYNSVEFGSCPTCRSREPETSTPDALALAVDPETTDDLLGKLAFHQDREVRAAVYANPNTPDWARNRLRREIAPNDIDNSVSDFSASGTQANRLYVPNPRVTTLDFIPGHTITELRGTIYATTSTVGTKAKTDDGSMINRLEGRLEHATRESLEKLWVKAQQAGGNAVVAIRMAAADSEGSGISSFRSSGIVLIGTAVRVVANPTQ